MKSDAFKLETPTQEPGLATAMEVIFQWNYDSEVEELRRLYVKAAEAQWVSERDLDWDRPIDLERFASTPLGLSLPVEKTSYWKAQPEEIRWKLTKSTAAFRLIVANCCGRDRDSPCRVGRLSAGRVAVRGRGGRGRAPSWAGGFGPSRSGGGRARAPLRR